MKEQLKVFLWMCVQLTVVWCRHQEVIHKTFHCWRRTLGRVIATAYRLHCRLSCFKYSITQSLLLLFVVVVVIVVVVMTSPPGTAYMGGQNVPKI